jgi:hypothetical protein
MLTIGNHAQLLSVEEEQRTLGAKRKEEAQVLMRQLQQALLPTNLLIFRK